MATRRGAEYEVKVRLSSSDVDKILSRLSLIGFTKEGDVFEEDHYVDLRGCPGYREGSVLRFRKVSSGSGVEYRLTYKSVVPSEGVKAREEVEVELQGEEVLSMLKMVGLRTITIRKSRTYLSGMGLKVSADRVDCLGTYLEFEEMDPASVKDFLDKVREVLKLLGLEVGDLITKSYLELYLEAGCG